MRRWRVLAGLAAILLAYVAFTRVAVPRPPLVQPAETPTPQSLDELRTAIAAVLTEEHVPGAGLALVRADGIEWVGGVGVANRETQAPVTADTHFRVGSISKTFVALSLVQLAEEGLLTLDDLVSSIIPDVAIDNPWETTHPIRIVHLLQHTAGFDDMHFAEMYNFSDAPDVPLAQALRLAPASRRVRWQPGTRMAYSNPGYGVAGLLIETIARQPYESYIRTHIFEPLGMTTSSFVLRPEDEATLARGYAGAALRDTGFPQIYLRPAGNLHTSPRELAAFVRMLLNWGELDKAFVVDPEYLGNMERPRSTVAATAGLRTGYGTGIMAWINLPYLMLGHGGGITGFASAYGYSPARDVGFVVLLNREDARGAMNRVTALVTRYLKRDTEPPASPAPAIVPLDTLRAYEGYYHEANPRNQLLAFLDWLWNGFSVRASEGTLHVTRAFGPSHTLVPVSETLFRRPEQTLATRVFTHAPDGHAIVSATFGGSEAYAERVPRWRVEIVRAPVIVATVLLATPVLLPLVLFLARRGKSRVPLALAGLVVGMLLAVFVPYASLGARPITEWGMRSYATIAAFLGSLALPILGVATLIVARQSYVRGASRAFVIYAALVAVSALIVSAYLASFGLIGIRLWMY